MSRMGCLCLPKQYINSEAPPIDYQLSLRWTNQFGDCPPLRVEELDYTDDYS
jgi:hypothetical protein